MQTWRKLFDQEIVDYTAHYAETGNCFGWFSVPRFDVAHKIGFVINDYCAGKSCLDIGCGAWPAPVYMHPGVKWTGVDPDYGFTKRNFPFVQAMGEELPFQSNSFTCATIMSVLDHALDPDHILSEAHRILAPSGHIFVWYRDEHHPDAHHLHFFNRGKMQQMLTAHGFTIIEQHHYSHSDKAGYPETMLAIGEKK